MAKKDLRSATKDATASMFSQTIGSEEQVAVTSKKEARKKTEKETKAQEKKVFSFRGDSSDVEKWRFFAKVSDIKVDELGALALNEYIKRHPLKGAEKALFDSKFQ